VIEKRALHLFNQHKATIFLSYKTHYAYLPVRLFVRFFLCHILSRIKFWFEKNIEKT